MKEHIVDSTYRQFYVADIGLNPAAPEDWTNEQVKQRYNAMENIVAFCPEGDITAKIITLSPGEVYNCEQEPDFVVSAKISIETGRLGIMGWPWEILEEYSVEPGIYLIRFSGYNLSAVETEDDFYVVEIEQ